jgi:hypothetical protein
MSIKQRLHQVLDELDADSAEEARAYLHSRQGRYGSGGTRTNVVTATEADDAARVDTWEDEGGSQAGDAAHERASDLSTGRSRASVRDDLEHLIAALDPESAVEALAYLQSLRRPRLLSEAGIDDEAGTEEEHDAAVEAWQLDRRHALDER